MRCLLVGIALLYILRAGTGNDDIGVYIFSDGKAVVSLGNNISRAGTTVSPIISPATWTHIAMVFDGAGATDAAN